jgi:hypothetical protein
LDAFACEQTLKPSTECTVGHCLGQRGCDCAFLWSFKRRGKSLKRYSIGQTKRKSWRLRLPGLSSPALITMRRRPHGVGKCTRNAHLGQSVLFIASRHPWTISVPQRRSAGAFFVGVLGRGMFVLWTMPVCGCWRVACVSTHPHCSGHQGKTATKKNEV